MRNLVINIIFIYIKKLIKINKINFLVINDNEI